MSGHVLNGHVLNGHVLNGHVLNGHVLNGWCSLCVCSACRALIGLGYEIAFDVQQNVVYQELDPAVYRQSNGYLPRPLDLSAITLPQTIAPLIERIAENIHNVWAADRIAEGWTYGVSEDPALKQNPAMVPYPLLDEKWKDSNR